MSFSFAGALCLGIAVTIFGFGLIALHKNEVPFAVLCFVMAGVDVAVGLV